MRDRREILEFVTATALLAAGVVAFAFGWGGVAQGLWAAAAVVGVVISTVSMWAAVRRRQPSVDIIALLALVGALAVGEPFAGAMVAVMLTTGMLLEARAAARARRELGLLVARTPRTARLHVGDTLVDVDVDEVKRGDRLLVGTGEVVPVDGRLVRPAVLDESALTGEPLPIERPAGDDVRSGVVNAGAPAELIATAAAAESTYAGVLRMVEQAQAASAPFVRVADRIAIYFVPFTLLLAGIAWLASGDPVRAVAVLVVATPCPLLLAAPIAIMSGLSRASKSGVIIKGGGALERLAAGRVLLFDKTGTLTQGKPVLAAVIAPAAVGSDELLALAASLDQVSPHVLATAIVTAARARGLELVLPDDVVEHHGYGLEGRVTGRQVRLGKADWIVSGTAPAWVRHARRRASLDGSLTVFVSVDGAPAGVFLLEDPIRADAPRMLRELRAAGITRTVLVTGDRADVAETVGRIVGVDAVQADRDPAEKVAVVSDEARHGPTIMVGDGVNDAPALATAGVGVALAARGATASSETADVVLTVDRIGVLADAILVARRSRRIAVQAVVVGMGLSLVAMVAAALGFLPPAVGALVQEVIDVLAIGIALRAVLPPRSRAAAMPAADVDLVRRLHVEHRAVRPVMEQVRVVADALGTGDLGLAPAVALLEQLQTVTLPHERAEQELLYPAVARALGGADPTGALSRSHAEIEHQIGRLSRLLGDLDGETVDAEDVVELRALLYGLYAILRLHDAQEEEGAFSLVPEPGLDPASLIRSRA
jgi:heavy metal translocating P-type ATPase